MSSPASSAAARGMRTSSPPSSATWPATGAASVADVLEHQRRRSERADGIGGTPRRKEDDRLLRGEGRFPGDVEYARALHMAVGRCPFPRARVVSVEIGAAVLIDGV